MPRTLLARASGALLAGLLLVAPGAFAQSLNGGSLGGGGASGSGGVGATGAPGRGITGTAITSGHLILTYSDNTTGDAGAVVGPAGAVGSAGRGIATATVNTANHLVLTYSDSSTADLGVVVGAAGAAGSAGRGVASAVVNGSNHLVLTYSDNSTSDLGNVVGAPGAAGTAGATGKGITASTVNSSGHLVLTYSDSSTVDAGLVQGAAGSPGAAGTAGAAGKSIASGAVNTSNHLILTFSDNSTSDVGVVVGPAGTAGAAGQAGAAGRGVSSAVVNGSNHLVLTYSDNSTADLGNVVGAAGTAGAAGNPGAAGSSFTSGNAVPASTVGNNGDSFELLTSGEVYQKVSGAWTDSGKSLIGPQGSGGATSYGTTAGTAAQGNDSRITGAVQANGGNAGNAVVVAPDTSFAQAIAARLNDHYNIAEHGALGDATSDNKAMTAAVAWATSNPGTHILIPDDLPGTTSWAFTVLSPTATGNNGGYGFEIPSFTTVEGEDQNATVVSWNDTNGAYLFSATSNASGGGRASNIMFRNFTVTGTWGTAVASSSTGAAAAAWDLGQAPFIPTNVDGLTFDHVTSENSRGYGISARSITGLVVANSHTLRTFSDAINMDGASDASIIDNHIEHTDDDAISVHSYLTDTWGVRRDLQITGNHIFDAQGIDVLSARHANISANTIDSFRQACISLSTLLPSNGSVEGNSADESILVSGNQCTNGINRTHVDNVNGGLSYITINGISARAGQYAVIPGENNTATGTVQDPFPEFAANSSSTGVAVAGGHGIVISNNLLARTLPRTDGTDSRYTQWSNLGQGLITSRVGGTQNPGASGSYNVATAGLHGLTEADMQGTCFNLTGGILRDVLIVGNHCSGQAEGLAVSGSAVHYDNIVFRDNTITDFTGHGVIEGATGKIQILVDSNLYDGDPWLKNAGHSTTGTWPNGSGPVLLDKLSGAGTGIVFKNNTLKNLALLLYNNNSGQVDFTDPASGYSFDQNTLYGQFSVAGFSSANAGIGEWRGPGFKTIVVDSNPQDNAYGTILSSPVSALAALPTDGTWVPGQVVLDSAPASGTATTAGTASSWTRATFGTGNVLGTDWIASNAVGTYGAYDYAATHPASTLYADKVGAYGLTVYAKTGSYTGNNFDCGTILKYSGSAPAYITPGQPAGCRVVIINAGTAALTVTTSGSGITANNGQGFIPIPIGGVGTIYADTTTDITLGVIAPTAAASAGASAFDTIFAESVTSRTFAAATECPALGRETIENASTAAVSYVVPTGLTVGCIFHVKQMAAGTAAVPGLITITAGTGETAELIGGANSTTGQYTDLSVLIDSASTFAVSGSR